MIQMQQKDAKNLFMDSPEPLELAKAIGRWRLPDPGQGLITRTSAPPLALFSDISLQYKSKLEPNLTPRSRAQNTKNLIFWLYAFIRLNVKRGRVFNLREVLRTGQADCLGYAKIFTTLSRLCELDVGVIEVVTDVRGSNVPHTAALVKLSGQKWQFVDFWYGSTNIRHRRLGLQVKRENSWKITDSDFLEIKKVEDIGYLPDQCVDAITLYIEGNRWLKESNYLEAVEKYHRAISLYPQNSRLYFNRAIAYEQLRQPEKAAADYARALRDESTLKRTTATEPQAVVNLIRLDEESISEQDQAIYLRHAGFITGQSVPPEKIAREMRLLPAEVEAILMKIQAIMP